MGHSAVFGKAMGYSAKTTQQYCKSLTHPLKDINSTNPKTYTTQVFKSLVTEDKKFCSLQWP
jgi:hypothetical protein